MRVSSVVVHWTRAKVVMGTNPGRVKIFIVSCSRHGIVLHCTNNCCTKVVYFSKIYCHTSLYVSAIVVPTSQVRSSAMLVLEIVENKNYEFRITSNDITSIPNVIKNPCSGLRAESYGQTDRNGLSYMRSSRENRAKNA
jgi:hypothetical protein